MTKVLFTFAAIIAISGAIAYDTIEFNYGMKVLNEHKQTVD